MSYMDSFLLSNYNANGAGAGPSANYKIVKPDVSASFNVSAGENRDLYTLAEFPAGTKTISIFTNSTMPNYFQSPGTNMRVALFLTDGVNSQVMSANANGGSYATVTVVSINLDVTSKIGRYVCIRSTSAPQSVHGSPIDYGSFSFSNVDANKPLKLVVRAESNNMSTTTSVSLRFTTCDIISM